MTQLETEQTTNANIARYLPLIARERPDQVAVVTEVGRDKQGQPCYEQLSFAELDAESDRYAWGLSGYGIGRGTRVLLMVPSGLPLICLTFALFKAGCVPILIDPAMGRRNLIQCIEECAPEALIGVERAHLARLLFPRPFRSVRRAVTVGRRLLWGGATLDELRPDLRSRFPIEQLRASDQAAIIFTTGSTGVPKGVLYEHGMFDAQIHSIRDLFAIEPGEVEMPAFPLFALFNVAMGATSAIPPIDPTRPAACDPARVVAFINDQAVTSTFGSPAIWNKVTAYCQEQQLSLPGLRRVLMAGAPVPLVIHQRFRTILAPGADSFTPYGATEALPITSIGGRELIEIVAANDDPGNGTCVGYPVPGVTLRLIAITDEPIVAWDETLVLPPGQVGEIVVKGPAVTKTYLNREQATCLAKIREGEQIWHRMGDLGRLDDVGRLWFYGRKSHRVCTKAGPLFTEPCELAFNRHPQVFRSALVGVSPAALGLSEQDGPQLPVIVIEPEAGSFPYDRREQARFAADLLSLAMQHPATRPVREVLFHPSFPVDIRHNAKIFREQLTVWAEKVLRLRYSTEQNA